MYVQGSSKSAIAASVFSSIPNSTLVLFTMVAIGTTLRMAKTGNREKDEPRLKLQNRRAAQQPDDCKRALHRPSDNFTSFADPSARRAQRRVH